MRTLQFSIICLYYYCSEIMKHTMYAAVALTMLFVIHKLVSWGLWVLSL